MGVGTDLRQRAPERVAARPIALSAHSACAGRLPPGTSFGEPQRCPMPSPPHPANRRAIAAWVLYDWAYGSFNTVVTTFVFATYFTQKVAAGRKLPLAQVQDAARGRVWTGADAKTKGLVDELGGFWTAAATAARLAGVDPANTHFKIYPRNRPILGSLRGLVSGADAVLETLGQVRVLLGLPGVREVVHSAADLPRGGVELRAPGLDSR